MTIGVRTAPLPVSIALPACTARVSGPSVPASCLSGRAGPVWVAFVIVALMPVPRCVR